MRGNTYHDNEYITCLKNFIYEKYFIKAIDISPAERGYYGETWKLKAKNGLYFIKLDYVTRHQTLFQNSLTVIDYLYNNGVDFINKIIKTQNGKLYSIFNSAILCVFEWIQGQNIETDDTKIFEYQMLCQIYSLTKEGFNIPRIEFSDSIANKFYKKREKLKNAFPNEQIQEINSIFENHSSLLSHCALQLSKISVICDKNKPNFYITHGDAGGNFFVGNNKNYIIDWDEVMYAPIERDAWVMCCHDWATKLFNKTLKQNNINYTILPERLAFFCYYMFFHYICEFIDDFPDYVSSKRINDFLSDNWIKERINFADKILL